MPSQSQTLVMFPTSTAAQPSTSSSPGPSAVANVGGATNAGSSRPRQNSTAGRQIPVSSQNNVSLNTTTANGNNGTTSGPSGASSSTTTTTTTGVPEDPFTFVNSMLGREVLLDVADGTIKQHIDLYLQRARDLLRPTRDRNPVMSYWFLHYCVKIGKDAHRNSAAFFMNVIDAMNKIREVSRKAEAIENENLGHAYIKDYASGLFAAADADERSGKWSKDTARSYLLAAHYYQILVAVGKAPKYQEIEASVARATSRAGQLAKELREKGGDALGGKNQSCDVGPSGLLPKGAPVFMKLATSDPSPRLGARTPLPPSPNPPKRELGPPPQDRAGGVQQRGARAGTAAPPSGGANPSRKRPTSMHGALGLPFGSANPSSTDAKPARPALKKYAVDDARLPSRSGVTFPGSGGDGPAPAVPPTSTNGGPVPRTRRFSEDRGNASRNEVFPLPSRLAELSRRLDASSRGVKTEGQNRSGGDGNGSAQPPAAPMLNPALAAIKKVHFSGSVVGGESSAASTPDVNPPVRGTGLDFPFPSSGAGPPILSSKEATRPRPSNLAPAMSALSATRPSNAANAPTTSSRLSSNVVNAQSASSTSSRTSSGPTLDVKESQHSRTRSQDRPVLDRSPRAGNVGLPVSGSASAGQTSSSFEQGRKRSNSVEQPSNFGSYGSQTTLHTPTPELGGGGSMSRPSGNAISAPSKGNAPPPPSPKGRPVQVPPPITMIQPGSSSASHQQPTPSPSPSPPSSQSVHVLAQQLKGASIGGGAATRSSQYQTPQIAASKPLPSSAHPTPMTTTSTLPTTISNSTVPTSRVSTTTAATTPAIYPGSLATGAPGMPPPDQLHSARKHTKYAESALQFDDVETARRELRLALAALDGLAHK